MFMPLLMLCQVIKKMFWTKQSNPISGKPAQVHELFKTTEIASHNMDANDMTIIFAEETIRYQSFNGLTTPDPPPDQGGRMEFNVTCGFISATQFSSYVRSVVSIDFATTQPLSSAIHEDG